MEVLTFLFILASIVLIGIYYSRLPEQIPIHFNWPSKDKNGLGSKDILWTGPIIFGILAVGINRLNRYPWIFNYPIHVTKENAEFNYRQATQMLRVLNLMTGFLCLFVTLLSILEVLGTAKELDNYPGPIFPILLIALPIIYLICVLMKNNV
nr:DUF1648 domain-containing protein [uncultured Allomuricauda sp.]